MHTTAERGSLVARVRRATVALLLLALVAVVAAQAAVAQPTEVIVSLTRILDHASLACHAASPYQ
jgi:hypothetical protein